MTVIRSERLLLEIMRSFGSLYKDDSPPPYWWTGGDASGEPIAVDPALCASLERRGVIRATDEPCGGATPYRLTERGAR